MTTEINLNDSIDLNSLFHLSYNFDLLKGVIKGLVQSQKESNLKLNELENKVTSKDLKIEE